MKLQRKRVGEPPVPNTRTFDVSRAQMFVKNMLQLFEAVIPPLVLKEQAAILLS